MSGSRRLAQWMRCSFSTLTVMGEDIGSEKSFVVGKNHLERSGMRPTY